MPVQASGLTRVMIVEDDRVTRERFARAISDDPRTTLAQADIDDQWHYYQQMAGVEREITEESEDAES